MQFRKTIIAMAVVGTFGLAGCETGGGGGGSGENENRLSVSTGDDRYVSSGSSVSVQGEAENKDSYIDRMEWSIVDGETDVRSAVEFRGDGACDFDADDNDGERDYGVEDEKTCAATLDIGDMHEDARIKLELTAYETGGLSDSSTMNLYIEGDADEVNVNAGANRTVEAESTLEHSCVTSGGMYYDGGAPTFEWVNLNDDEIIGEGISLNYQYSNESGELQMEVPDAPTGTEVVMGCTVTDDIGQSATDDVTFTVAQPEEEVVPEPDDLVADAGPDLEVAPGDYVDLEGTVTVDGEESTGHYYQWVELTETSIDLDNENQRVAGFLAPNEAVEGLFEFRAHHEPIDGDTDFDELATDRMTVEIIPDDVDGRLILDTGEYQIAIAGQDEPIVFSVDVQEEGGGGGPYYYYWEHISGPMGGGVQGRETDTVSFQAPDEEAEIVFEVTVSRDPIGSGGDEYTALAYASVVEEED